MPAVSGNAKRIVSLLPSATEWVCALGLRDRLVGVSHQCDYPADIVDLPQVTRSRIDSGQPSGQIDAAVREHSDSRTPLYEVDARLIKALQPDLILTQTICNVCAVSQSDLMRTITLLDGSCMVLDLRGRTFVGVIDDARMMIDVTGNQPVSLDAIAAMERQIAAIRALPPAQRSRRPRVTLLEWVDPLYCAGHWTPELIRWAGGDDPIGDTGQPSRMIDPEVLMEADPEILLVACCGFDAARSRAEMDRLRELDGWESLSCVVGDQVHTFDGSAWFNRPGPRLVEALASVADLVAHWHPGV